MRLVIEGIETPIDICRGRPRVIEVHNRTLFARIARSLASRDGEDAFEPYSLWDDDGAELKPSSTLLMVSDPLRLPWENKALSGRLFDMVEGLMLEDEELRVEIEGMGARLAKGISRLTHQVNAEYSFAVEWGLRQYLKSFSFSVEHLDGDNYLESLISFLDFCADMALKQVLVFVNLKTFLSGNDLIEFYDRVFFHDLRVLMLEAMVDEISYEHERKTVIDLHFLES